MKVDKTHGERVAHPYEPGQWMEFRLLTVAEVREVAKIEDPAESTDRQLEFAITAWSYPEPVSRAAIAEQDSGTVLWAVREVTRRLTRGSDEGEVSAPASLTIT